MQNWKRNGPQAYKHTNIRGILVLDGLEGESFHHFRIADKPGVTA